MVRVGPQSPYGLSRSASLKAADTDDHQKARTLRACGSDSDRKIPANWTEKSFHFLGEKPHRHPTPPDILRPERCKRPAPVAATEMRISDSP